MSNSLKGKIALITGAANGIGAAIAKAFAKEGAQLILVDQDTKGLEEVDDYVQSIDGHATLVPFDIKEFGKIEELALRIADRFKGLDIFVGAAAILGNLGPVTHLKPEIWQNVLDVNLTANWHFLRCFDPLLKKSSAGQAIFLTSSCASEVTPYWSSYSISKAALEMMVKMYAREIENTYPNLKIRLFDPGEVNTHLRWQAMPGEDKSKIATADEVAQRLLLEAA